ncbi:MAG: SUMF1/EgtB/PvdO family nonheme iron enzyme [Bacteroidales bacterium]|nr:SUMF1/EgtB/PvdO family nonheme iron enzyme [Bacteroidales bacterium]
MKLILLSITLFFPLLFCAQVSSDYVFINGGKFKMGSTINNDEKPIHTVKISDFYILNHEVTNSEYATFLNVVGNQFESHIQWINIEGEWRNCKCRIFEQDSTYYVEKGYENYPVTFVNWYGANAYAKWVGGQLPTEAQWEYVAYLSEQEIINTNVDIKKYALVKQNSEYKVNPVKTTDPLLDIYDLFGNLAEWCSDWYFVDYYKKSARKNPLGPPLGDQKVIRGGSFATNITAVNKSNRRASSPTNHNITIGFRVVKLAK